MFVMSMNFYHSKNLKMNTIKTIGNVTHSRTSEFQKAVFINDASVAYEILDELIEGDWYPFDTDCAWTDIAVIDGKYYAAFGEDSVFASDSKLIYVEIEPTRGMIKEFEYFKQY